MKIKRYVYIVSFVVFGILLQLLIHAWLEIRYINLLTGDFARYGLGLSWSQWFLLHYVLTVVLFIAGALFGLWCGVFFWKKIYLRE